MAKPSSHVAGEIEVQNRLAIPATKAVIGLARQKAGDTPLETLLGHPLLSCCNPEQEILARCPS